MSEWLESLYTLPVTNEIDEKIPDAEDGRGRMTTDKVIYSSP